MAKRHFHPAWLAFFFTALDARLFSVDDDIITPLRCFPALCITLAATIIIIYGGTFDCLLPRAIPWPLSLFIQFLFSAFFLELALQIFWIPLETALTEKTGRMAYAIDDLCRKEAGLWCWLSPITTHLSDSCVLALITYIVATTLLLSILHATKFIDMRLSKCSPRNLCQKAKKLFKRNDQCH